MEWIQLVSRSTRFFIDRWCGSLSRESIVQLMDWRGLCAFDKTFQRNVCIPQNHYFYSDWCLCRLEIQTPATGNVSIRSNATLVSRNVIGTFTAEYDPNITTNNVHITVNLQTTSRALQNSTLVCYDSVGEVRGLAIFVCLSLNVQIY